LTGVITALATTTLLTSDVNPSGLTTNVTLTATVTGVPPAADLPTGEVVFSANGAPFATNGLISGSTTASTTSLPTGTNAMTAQYLGDGNHLPSSSGTLPQVVTNNVIYSQINKVKSLVDNHDGTFTLCSVGTPRAEYYLVSSGQIDAPMADWTPVVGSTNIASSPSGQWCCVVSNAAPAFFRSVAVNPATNSVTYSQVNGIESLVNNGDGTFTLNLLGTPGANYYVVVSGDISTPMAPWTALAGSTNTAASPSGRWSLVVNNAAPAFFRSVAINPTP
jgi:hypothetical protein